MSKIPIEIVLQDPNNPIVPDTNTNILVPNTALGEGYITKDSSGNFEFFSKSNATVSIVFIVILMLALSTMILLLVRRHQKHKKDNAEVSRKERLTTFASETIVAMAVTMLIGQLCMTTTSAIVENATTLDVADKIQIIANRYEDTTVTASVKNVSYASTDATFGYKVFMSMVGDTANLYLNGDVSSEHYFAPTENSDLSNNSWGYSLDDGNSYLAMPISGNAAIARQNTEVAEDDELDVYYSVKADKDLPFGVYKGEVEYTIEGYNGFPKTLTLMQQMTPEICSAVYTPSSTEVIVPTATLKDARDQKTYEIAKLADGNCWMTQNLDLDLNSETTLTSADTDISVNWKPIRSTIKQDESLSDTWNRDYFTPYSYDPGELYVYSSNNTDNDEQYTSLADCQADHPDCGVHNRVGNYYNWSAAVASNDTSAMEEKFANAEGSICPAGWGLPKNANADSYVEGNEQITMVKSFDGILSYYIPAGPPGGYYEYQNEDSLNKIRIAPLWLIRSGYLDDSTRALRGVGIYGSYWSSTDYGVESGTAYAYALRFLNYEVDPAIYYRRSQGYPVRCVAN